MSPRAVGANLRALVLLPAIALATPTAAGAQGTLATPPSEAELATLDRDVRDRELRDLMAFRGRWRPTFHLGVAWLTMREHPLGSYVTRSDAWTAVIAAGLRRAVLPALDLGVRVAFTGPLAVRRTYPDGACPTNQAPEYPDAGLPASLGTLFHLGLDARARPFGGLYPVYVGAGLQATLSVVSGDPGSVLACTGNDPATGFTVHTTHPQSTPTTAAFSAAWMLMVGTQFGPRDLIDVGFQYWNYPSVGAWKGDAVVLVVGLTPFRGW